MDLNKLTLQDLELAEDGTITNQKFDDNILIDPKSKNKWSEKKVDSMLYADSLKRLGYTKKSYRVRDCGTFLEFKRYQENNELKLNKANFCKARLCPMCSWRRSLKIFGQVSKVMHYLTNNYTYRYIFLTLTVKNCSGEELKDHIDMLLKGYAKMVQRKAYKKVVKGSFKALEVTHNLDKSSKDYDTYHPHLHVILAVSTTYFMSKDYYLNHKEWAALWCSCCNLDYEPIIHVKSDNFKIGKDVQKSVAEYAKYSTKSNDYIIKDDDKVNEKND